jgi:16S rRNA (guanine527-N7)-methyltransferase
VAIARPDIAVTLLDTNSKKTRFLQQVKAELGLTNITVVHARVEQAQLPKFSMITARAFATIEDIIDLTGIHCDDAGCLLLMKGLYPSEELSVINEQFALHDVVELSVPDCSAERHLVRLIKN